MEVLIELGPKTKRGGNARGLWTSTPSRAARDRACRRDDDGGDAGCGEGAAHWHPVNEDAGPFLRFFSLRDRRRGRPHGLSDGFVRTAPQVPRHTSLQKTGGRREGKPTKRADEGEAGFFFDRCGPRRSWIGKT